MRSQDAVWYDSLYDGTAHRGYAVRARMETVLRLAGAGPGDALDVGMGPGRLCDELDGVGWTVSGVDVSPEMIELARARVPHASARLVLASAGGLPFDDHSFDLVTATGVLEYSGVSRTLRELARVVRPGGRVVVSYPVETSIYAIWKTRVYYPLARSTKRLIRYSGRPQTPGAPLPAGRRVADLLAHVGLTVTAIVPTCYLVLPSPVDEMFPRAEEWLGRRLQARRVAPRRLATQVVIETTGLVDSRTVDHSSRRKVAVW